MLVFVLEHCDIVLCTSYIIPLNMLKRTVGNHVSAHYLGKGQVGEARRSREGLVSDRAKGGGQGESPEGGAAGKE